MEGRLAELEQQRAQLKAELDSAAASMETIELAKKALGERERMQRQAEGGITQHKAELVAGTEELLLSSTRTP